MALAPAETLEHANLTKTWNAFDVNNAINSGVAATNAQTLLYQVKTWLLTLTGFSVRNSCLDASVSSSDLITAPGDVVMSATGTWIVLDHTAGYQVMLHATGAATVAVTVALLGDFSTGTSTVNPVSATNTVSSNTLVINAASQIVWSGGATSDGKSFYVITAGSATFKSFSGVFEGLLIEERANSSQFAFLYATSSASMPTVILTIGGASVTATVVTAHGYGNNPASATSTSYGGKYRAAQIGAGFSAPTLYMQQIYDVYLSGTGLTFGDRGLSGAANAEMLSAGSGWMVPWNNTVLQVT